MPGSLVRCCRPDNGMDYLQTPSTPLTIDCLEGISYAVTSNELRKRVRDTGLCVEVRQKGSHLRIRCVTTGRVASTTIPVKTGDLPIGTLRSIERDLSSVLGEGWLTR